MYDDGWRVATPTTEGECLVALREAAERLGESPTKAQYDPLCANCHRVEHHATECEGG